MRMPTRKHVTRGWVTSKTALADPVAVADADHVVGQALDGEVLPELPGDEVVAPQLALPVAVGIELVDEHRAHLAAVPAQIALAIAVDVQAAHHPRPVDRVLPHRRVHRAALPHHVPRHAHVDRDQPPDDIARHPISFAWDGR